MITEFAEIEVKPGHEADFIAGVEASRAVFLAYQGCHALELHRGIESPAHFVLNIKWDDVATHQAFRESPGFQVWRGNVSGFFAGAPKVWHSETVA
ncbi:MAG: antibiotic biosynthesis monooxygenase [Acidocella sp.]|nr:antibiotic biosynthesis monooxygenase [Acidocella sp.]